LETVPFLSSLVKMLVALAIVLGMMIGTMYFIKKILHSTSPAMNSGSLIKILASRYLGPKNSILVVDVAGQIIVVGLSNQQMNVLTTISDKEVLDKLRTVSVKEEIHSVVLTEEFVRYKEKIMSAMDKFKK